jgi:FlaA1/EpsC-like NDP-sugar epimerase
VKLNIDDFIVSAITKRKNSHFANDLQKYHTVLQNSIEGKNVLVIGGAGTIGSAYIRALLPFRPSKVVVCDINENGLTELVRDCRSRKDFFVPKDFITYPVNFGDTVFTKIFEQHGSFDIVANFAAHKHVRSEKDIFSIEAMIENNVIKAQKLLDLVAQNRATKFFCVSTDKAANPVNIMGASKKLMEELILAYAQNLNITTARFANVAFSNGSLLEGFINRTNKNQPLSCPSDVRRFFVSPDESGQICLLANILGKSGEIFFPKLREDQMVNFKDIADAYINAIGKTPFVCTSEDEAKAYFENHPQTNHYPVYYFASHTSGEKLYEEFYTESEKLDLVRFAGLGVIIDLPKKEKVEMEWVIQEFAKLFATKQYGKKDIVYIFSKVIPNFNHIETGLGLDQKM